MKITAALVAAAAVALGPLFATQDDPTPTSTTSDLHPMDLGAFSVSLAVKDIRASRDFYAKLGFAEAGGNIEQNWLILRNGTSTIGLFQGMFEKNIMTFNPGWDAQAEPVEEFTDVRELQRLAEANGLSITTRAPEGTKGPASFVLVDPDGNPILVDQHVE